MSTNAASIDGSTFCTLPRKTLPIIESDPVCETKCSTRMPSSSSATCARSPRWRTAITRSTDSRRARNSASVRICGRLREESRESRRRCRLASSRVDPRTPCTSFEARSDRRSSRRSPPATAAARGRARRCCPGRPHGAFRPRTCAGDAADAGGCRRHRPANSRRCLRHRKRRPRSSSDSSSDVGRRLTVVRRHGLLATDASAILGLRRPLRGVGRATLRWPRPMPDRLAVGLGRGHGDRADGAGHVRTTRHRTRRTRPAAASCSTGATGVDLVSRASRSAVRLLPIPAQQHGRRLICGPCRTGRACAGRLRRRARRVRRPVRPRSWSDSRHPTAGRAPAGASAGGRNSGLIACPPLAGSVAGDVSVRRLRRVPSGADAAGAVVRHGRVRRRRAAPGSPPARPRAAPMTMRC